MVHSFATAVTSCMRSVNITEKGEYSSLLMELMEQVHGYTICTLKSGYQGKRMYSMPAIWTVHWFKLSIWLYNEPCTQVLYYDEFYKKCWSVKAAASIAQQCQYAERSLPWLLRLQCVMYVYVLLSPHRHSKQAASHLNLKLRWHHLLSSLPQPPSLVTPFPKLSLI